MSKTPSQVDALETLDDVAVWIVDQLARASRDKRSAYRVGVLASVRADGAPDARNVVLRSHDRARGVISIHTDARSAKVGQFETEPRAALVLWDPGRGVQMRLDGAVTVLRDGPARDAAWIGLPAPARRDYAATAAPGTPRDDADATYDEGLAATYFTLLAFRIAAVDWLHLGRGGHRRARFEMRGGAGWDASWLVP